MRIDEIVESNEFWQSVGRQTGRALGQVLKPAGAAAAVPAASRPIYQTARRAGQALKQALKPAKAPTSAVVPAASTQSQPQAVSAGPEVMSQPIRVGKKVYKPGDPMHARLAKMLQAQQKS